MPCNTFFSLPTHAFQEGVYDRRTTPTHTTALYGFSDASTPSAWSAPNGES
ncbi:MULTISPECIES: hypothetical protein [unclassified Leptolyngbya]|uniref:hypothetical protein n=1 Tax=unclassified Leptolyngbya TaxID=2650499 RepID=UPI001F5530E5|nr:MULTISPECIES: hypothetical protein [unclassified Leptolyngbya]